MTLTCVHGVLVQLVALPDVLGVGCQRGSCYAATVAKCNAHPPASRSLIHDQLAVPAVHPVCQA
jgi:hypothetical protein